MTGRRRDLFGQVLLAWAVHALTATGAVLAILAIDALFRGNWREVLLWQLLALAIDGIDGTLARAVRVRDVIPCIDGAALDLIIDYLNYVLVPSLLLWRADLLPAAWALPLIILIQMSSLYVFVRRDMKTDDGYFRGFPALWNVVAAYLLLTMPAPGAAAAVVVLLSALSFAPVLVIHPFRARQLWPLGPVLASLWAGATLATVLLPSEQPAASIGWLLSLASLAGLALLSALRTALWR